MKKLLGGLFLMTALMPIANTVKAEHKEGTLIDRTAQAVDFTQSIDMSDYGTLSLQAVYSDGTPAGHTINTGVKETATITVDSNSTNLISARASVTVSIVSTTSVVGDAVTLNGIKFTEGIDWVVSTSSSLAALNLATKIDADSNFATTVAGATVTVYAQSTGSFANVWPVLTTDATNLKISAATFGSGKDRTSININGTILTESVDFSANSSSQTTAHNITTAVNANTTINTQVIASSSAAVVTLTALYPGVRNYYVISSTTGYTISNFSPGAPSELDIESDKFTQTNHLLTTGLKVLFATVTASVAPTGLTNQTTYYAIKLNENQYQLATSSTLAVAGTAINMTTIPTASSTYTVTPLALSVAGSNGISWQGSNNGTNFSNLSVTTVTYSAAGNTLIDLDDYAYKYLRIVFLGPTNGGIAFSVKAYGKEE